MSIYHVYINEVIHHRSVCLCMVIYLCYVDKNEFDTPIAPCMLIYVNMFIKMRMSVKLLSLHVATGSMTCVPTCKAPTSANVITQVIAGLEKAVPARVSKGLDIKAIRLSHGIITLSTLTQN